MALVFNPDQKLEVGDLAFRRMESKEFSAPVRVIKVLNGHMSGPLQEVEVEHLTHYEWELGDGAVGTAEVGATARVMALQLKKSNIVEVMAAVEKSNEK